MKGFEVLYYPDFQPPASWLRAFLLLFDKVRTLVPDTVEPDLSEPVLEVLENLPGSLECVPPVPLDTQFAAWNMTRLRAAFAHIHEKSDMTREIAFTFDGGSVSIEGHTFLHDVKMSDAVRRLLEEFELIQPRLKPMIEGLGIEGFSVVRHEAADLIVSLVADRVGQRNGWNTVTDRRMDFLVNSVNTVDRTIPNSAAVELASSIVRCVVPKQVVDIDIGLYRDIREEYAELRAALARLVVSVAEIGALETIKDVEVVSERIKSFTADLSAGVERMRRTSVGRSIREWAPVGVGAIGTLIGACAGQLGLGLAASVSVGVGLEAVKKIIGREKQQSEERRIYRLLGNLQADVLTAAELRWIT